MENNAEYWIEKLKLAEHPEGGYFAPSYRAAEQIYEKPLPSSRASGERAAVSSIYYLLKQGQFSAFHRLKSIEIWNFHAGSPLTIYILDSSGGLIERKLGRNIEKGESLQVAIEPEQWFGAKHHGPGEYTLVGCTVVPGFEWEEFELAKRDELTGEYPRHREIIRVLTR